MQKKVKILFIIESLASTGGAEHALVNLLPALVGAGYECEVAALWSPYDLSIRLGDKGIKVHKLELKFRWDIFGGVYKLFKLNKLNKYQIIHAHNFFPSFYTAISKPFFMDVKRITTFHNLGYDSFPANTLYKKARKKIDSLLNRFFIDEHIGVSNAVACSYKKHLKLKNISVINNAVPVDEIVEQGKKNIDVIKKYRLDDDCFLIVMPARLIREKGHKYMLEAMKILKAKGVTPKLLILGDGVLKNDICRQIEELQLDEQVILKSTIPHGELFPIIKRADAVVLSSTHEGFPLAPTEAMALYTPVIATNVGGLPDLIEDGISGLLIPSKDSSVLATSIERLINEPDLRRELANGGWDRINENFRVEVIVKKWDRFYRNFLNSKNYNS